MRNGYKFYRGGAEDGEIAVQRDLFYGEEFVSIEFDSAVNQVHLTSGQARAIAHDLMTEADALDVPLPGHSASLNSSRPGRSTA